MPVWHEVTREARESGKLAILGVIQEQHPDRCRLFAQWKGIDWPILHDPINRLGTRVVPMFVAIDEAGIVVDDNLRTSELDGFLSRPPNTPAEASAEASAEESVVESQFSGNAAVEQASRLIGEGDDVVLWKKTAEINTAIDRYTRAIQLAPEHAGARFRLGVALRMRYDSARPRSGDFQAAVDAWGQALDLDPNHYIYRRRIQQYGPRLIKPYPFYDWVERARKEITARGETPHPLSIDPVGAEIAQPSKSFKTDSAVPDEPDPAGRITRDRRFARVTATVVPGEFKPGESARVHLRFDLNGRSHWNNESEPLRVWIDVPENWNADTRLLEADQPLEPESRETRSVDFELQAPTSSSVDTINAYALYYLCEEEGGQCLYLRQDIQIPIRFASADEH